LLWGVFPFPKLIKYRECLTRRFQISDLLVEFVQEDAGRLRFVCHSNDGIDQHMIWLIGLKNIFARQLPNMPKEYIVRLVMDR
jgi:hypothetical protein